MTEWKNWLMDVIVVCAVASICYTFVPKGKFQTIIRCGGGILLVMTLIKPLVRMDWTSIGQGYREWEWEIEEKTKEYQMEQNTELELLIEEKCAAYIEEKARSLGVECHAKIECTEQEGIPLPSNIVLDIPYFEQLSEQIAADLDVPKERQYWQEVEK